MTTVRYPYKLMEMEFVKSDDLTIRELGRRNGIPDNRMSTVHEWARKHGWMEKRLERQQRTNDRTLTMLAELEAKRQLREAEVVDNLIDLVDEAITKVRIDLYATKAVKQSDGTTVHEPVMRLRPREITDLIDRVMTVFGRRTEPEGLPSGGAFAQLTVGANDQGLDLLARLAEAARSRAVGAEPRRVTGAALPTSPEHSQDQLG